MLNSLVYINWKNDFVVILHQYDPFPLNGQLPQGPLGSLVSEISGWTLVISEMSHPYISACYSVSAPSVFLVCNLVTLRCHTEETVELNSI